MPPLGRSTNRIGSLASRQPGCRAAGLRPARGGRTPAHACGVRARGSRRGRAGRAILAAARRGGASRGALSQAYEYAARAARTDGSAECQILAGASDGRAATDELASPTPKARLRSSRGLVGDARQRGRSSVSAARAARARYAGTAGRREPGRCSAAARRRRRSDPSTRRGADVRRASARARSRRVDAGARDAGWPSPNRCRSVPARAQHRELAETLRALGEM